MDHGQADREPKLSASHDPNDPRNGAAYHTGKPCIEEGCDQPAGTAWGKFWCFAHNVERMDRIEQQLRALATPRAAAP